MILRHGLQARLETRAPCVRESGQHTVTNVGHIDGLRTDGVIDERTSPSVFLDGFAHCSFATIECGPWGTTCRLGLLLRVADQQQRPHVDHHGGINSEELPLGFSTLLVTKCVI
jgi:hypothetical protein